MAKVEIEVPDGKVADITKDGDKVVVTFKEASILDCLKDFGAVVKYLSGLASNDVEWAVRLLEEYKMTKPGTYSERITAYRMVVAALTNNEQRHLTTGERWYPVVQFCRPKDVKNCWGNEVIGRIKSEGQEFVVVGGAAHYGATAGLGSFHSDGGVSTSWTYVGFRSVSSEEIAKHISKYFGKLLFEVHYGGTNCDWSWKN